MPSLQVVAGVVLAISVLIVTVTAAYWRLVEAPERPPRRRRAPGRHRRPRYPGLNRRGGFVPLGMLPPPCDRWIRL